jgi:hypothetical protein
MKQALSIAVIVLVCGCSPQKAFVKAVNDYTGVILPEYTHYLQNDSTLSDDTKRIRTQTAEKFQQLITDELNRK